MAATTCVVVGGGPAGMMLGYLLARGGVDVTVLEKHADFLRDFRGDTIHPSTARLMDELGLGEQFGALPLRRSETVSLVTDDGTYTVADFRRIPGPHVLGFLPQWDFLDFMVDQGRQHAPFTVRMRSAAVDLVTDGGRVVGVTVEDADGTRSQVRADLVVAADGRDSTIREAAGLAQRTFGAPFDVLWFRVSRREGDPESSLGRLVRGHFMVMINRGEYWQVAYPILKGSGDDVRAAGLDAFRDGLTAVAPFLGDRVDELTSWDDAPLLRVQVDRLRRWWRPGLLCIGDAAHAMSPLFGVGINLAIQDAVAAARILTPALRAGRVAPWHLARVQLRRTLPVVVTQAVQLIAQERAIRPLLAGHAGARAPLAIRVLDRVPALQALPAWAIGHGVLPEHPPALPPPPAA